MPVQDCTVDGRPGFKCGPSGKCYPYTAGDASSRSRARQQAVNQCIAIGEPLGGASMKASELNRILDDRRRAVEAELPALTALYSRLLNRQGRKAAAALRKQTRLVTTAATGWQLPPEGNLFDPEETAEYAQAQLEATHTRIFWSVAGAPLTSAGISWTVTNPFAVAFIDGLGKRTGQALDEAVQPVIRETVFKAYEAGLSVPDTAALIQEQVTTRSPAQAQMLARTDLNGLANGASTMAATVVGVQYKQWLTAEDDKVRPTHVDADGQTVPIDQPFLVGGESLDYPGDPAGSDEETCNCRCTVIYVDPAEAVEAQTASAARLLERSAATSERAVLTIQETIATMGGVLERLQAPGVQVDVHVPARRRVDVHRNEQGEIDYLIIEEM